MVAIEELFNLYLYFTYVTKLNSDMAYLLLLCYNYLGRFLNLVECFECEKKKKNRQHFLLSKGSLVVNQCSQPL